MRQRRLARPAVPFLACLLAVTTACGGDDDEADAAPRRSTTTAAPETTSTTLDPQEAARQEVIAASQAAWQARVDSAAPPNPDPDHPAVVQTHTGAMLEQWIDALTIFQFNRVALRFPANSQHRIEVESVSFDEVEGEEVAYLEVCTVDDSERFIIDTGEILDSGVHTIQTTEAMKKVDGVWKLAERRENNTWEGVAGCAVD